MNENLIEYIMIGCIILEILILGIIISFLTSMFDLTNTERLLFVCGVGLLNLFVIDKIITFFEEDKEVDK